jgi:hypothetical protein
MFAQFEFQSDVSILQAFCQKADDIFFPSGQRPHSSRADNSHRRELRKRIHDIHEFTTACPNLPGMDLLDTPAQ